MDFRRLPICIVPPERASDLGATLTSVRTAMDAGGMCGPALLFQDAPADDASREACRDTFLDVIPHGVVFAAPQRLGRAGNLRRAEGWAFETMRYPAALFFTNAVAVSRDYFPVMQRLHDLALAQPRIAMFAACGTDPQVPPVAPGEREAQVGPMRQSAAYGCVRDAWLKCQQQLAGYLELLADCGGADPPLDHAAMWYARIGWPPLPNTLDAARSAALNTLGLARIASVTVCAGAVTDGTYPDGVPVFDPVSDPTVDAIVAVQRAEAMRGRLGVDAFIGCEGLIDALRVIRQIGGEALLGERSGSLVASASGFYPDRWSHPLASIALSSGAALREVTLQGIAAQHLPRGSSVTVLLNGQLASAVWLDPGEAFAMTLPLPRRLDGLEKLLETRCSVAIDPYSVGFNEDRRKLGYLLASLTLTLADGTTTVIGGDTVVNPSH